MNPNQPPQTPNQAKCYDGKPHHEMKGWCIVCGTRLVEPPQTQLTAIDLTCLFCSQPAGSPCIHGYNEVGERFHWSRIMAAFRENHEAEARLPVIQGTATETATDDDNFTKAARFAGITFSQGCQFHLFLRYLLGQGPAPGFLPAEPVAAPLSPPQAYGYCAFHKARFDGNSDCPHCKQNEIQILKIALRLETERANNAEAAPLSPEKTPIETSNSAELFMRFMVHALRIVGGIFLSARRCRTLCKISRTR